MEPFGARLHRAMRERGQLCVGLDPHAELLAAWGLADTPDGLRRFTDTVIGALADRVAVMKPQSAFFERFGSAGIAVLESAIRQLREAGALVLLDVKRGDIGSTMAAYAQAYLHPDAPLAVDAITATPYLGFGSLAPAIEAALGYGAGVFVVTLTSNPQGAAVQRAISHDGRTVAHAILDEIARLNQDAYPLGSIGAVIGATIDPVEYDLARLNAPLLVPGMGSQGGTPERLRSVVGSSRRVALPSYSREVLRHGPSVAGLRDAATRLAQACAAALVE